MKAKAIPKFNTHNEEAKFWEENDSVDYLDWSKAKTAKFPNLKPSATTISLRLPATLLNEIKIMAHKDDVPYQSLIKILLADAMLSKRRQKAIKPRADK
jgi:predicted DNA binding CopG/RHH family protein